MSGALLEVHGGPHVRVIHSSVVEYFQSLRIQQHKAEPSLGPLTGLEGLLNTREDEREIYFMLS